MQQTVSSIPCNLCASTDTEEISLVDRDNQYLRSVICRKCGLSWTDPRQNEEEIQKYYSKDYRIAYKGTYIPRLKHVYRAGRIADHRYGFIKDLIKPNDKVLDVGAGGGEFVFRLRKAGFDAEGIEPNEGYGTYAKETLELPIRIGFVQQFELPDDHYDLITLHHVFEHLDDPAKILNKLRKALKMKGFLVIDVPNIEGTCFAPIHRFHKAHLYNFNQENLERMGIKGGFSVYKTVISDDGGVITTIFQKDETEGGLSGEIPGNYERVAKIVRGHSTGTHYLTTSPYVRPIQKLQKSLSERRAVWDCKTGREVLERMFGGK
jgi:2-polyprenyl-3-methyl-5-hydroxy-6-metoxy-1,4-benzoquinol methylase